MYNRPWSRSSKLKNHESHSCDSWPAPQGLVVGENDVFFKKNDVPTDLAPFAIKFFKEELEKMMGEFKKENVSFLKWRKEVKSKVRRLERIIRYKQIMAKIRLSLTGDAVKYEEFLRSLDDTAEEVYWLHHKLDGTRVKALEIHREYLPANYHNLWCNLADRARELQEERVKKNGKLLLDRGDRKIFSYNGNIFLEENIKGHHFFDGGRGVLSSLTGEELKIVS